MFLQAEDYEEPDNTLKPVGRRPPQPIPNPEPFSQDVRTFNVSKLCQLSLFQLYTLITNSKFPKMVQILKSSGIQNLQLKCMSTPLCFCHFYKGEQLFYKGEQFFYKGEQLL